MYQPIILNYSMSALEPFISKRTMEAHYFRLYMTYLNNLNGILKRNRFDFSYPVEDLFLHIEDFPEYEREDILYNAGGVINHELYFSQLSPFATRDMSDVLSQGIIRSFGSISAFKEEFTNFAKELRGSGYTFLVSDKNGNLSLINMANQESLYMIGKTPIMNIDVWEHAYYLDQLNERINYIENFLKVLDFDVVNRRYQNVLNNIQI